MKIRSLCALIAVLVLGSALASNVASQTPTPTGGGLVIGPTPTAAPPTATSAPQHSFAHPYYGWQLTLPDTYEIQYTNPDSFTIDGVQFETITPDQIGWLDYGPDFTDASSCLTASDTEVLLDSAGNPIRQRNPVDSWELYQSESGGVVYVRCVVLFPNIALLKISATAQDAETYNANVAPLLQLVSDNLTTPEPGSVFAPPSAPTLAEDDFVRLLPEPDSSICLLYYDPSPSASWSSPDDACTQRYVLHGDPVWVNGAYWWELAYGTGAMSGYSAGYATETQLKPWPRKTDTPASGSLLYAMDPEGDLSDWAAAGTWTMQDGVLRSTSEQATFAYLLPPFHVNETDDYAIEAEIRLVDATHCGAFGLSARGESAGAYHMMVTWLGNDCEYNYINGENVEPGPRLAVAAIDPNGSPIDDEPGCTDPYLDRACPHYIAQSGFDPGEDWHTYRVEVRGDEISVFVDGEFVLFGIDSALTSGGEIGFWTYGANFASRSFAVYSLS